MLKILITVGIAGFLGLFLCAGVTETLYSKHPMLSLAMGFILLTLICFLIIKHKRKNFMYAFLLSFPFLSIGFSGISIFIIFTTLMSFIFFPQIVKYIRNEHDFFKKPLFLLLVSAILTTFIAAYKWEAIYQIIFLTGLFVVYITLKIILNSELERRRVFVILNIILSFALLIAILQTIFGVDKIKLISGDYFTNVSKVEYVSRIPSFFKDSLEAGLFFPVMACLALGLAVSYFKKSIWVKINFLLSVSILFFNATRIAIISFVIALLCISLIKPTAKKIAIVIFVLFIISSILWTSRFYLPAQFVHRTTQHEVDKSLYFRLKLWKSCWPLIKDNPFGVGLGRVNAYTAVIKARVNPLLVYPALTPGRYETDFENTYLEILYSLGIVGFLCFIYILFKFFIITYKSVSKTKANVQNVFDKYLLGCMIIWAISVITSPRFSYPQSMILFILLLSLVSDSRVTKEERSYDQILIKKSFKNDHTNE